MQKAFGNLNFLREGSYKLAERYMTDQIIGQWRVFLTNREKITMYYLVNEWTSDDERLRET